MSAQDDDGGNLTRGELATFGVILAAALALIAGLLAYGERLFGAAW